MNFEESVISLMENFTEWAVFGMSSAMADQTFPLGPALPMQYISTKQLRQVFPEVRAALAQGEEYVLIHRSQPIAKLVPLEEDTPKAKNQKPKDTKPQTEEHITTHLLPKPMTLPTPAGYSHPVAFKHHSHNLKETVHLIKPAKAL